MKIKYYSILIVLFGLIVSCGAVNKDLPSIKVSELQARLKTDTSLVLLDVRTPEEYNGPLGHIDGSLLIPLSELESRISELDKYKDKEIIVYCRSGNRSHTATGILLDKGFKAVNMLGGMKAWDSLPQNQK